MSSSKEKLEKESSSENSSANSRASSESPPKNEKPINQKKSSSPSASKSKSRSRDRRKERSRSRSRSKQQDSRNYSPRNPQRPENNRGRSNRYDDKRNFSRRDSMNYSKGRDKYHHKKYGSSFENSRSRSQEGKQGKRRKAKKRVVVIPSPDEPFHSYEDFLNKQYPETLDSVVASTYYNKYKTEWETRQIQAFYREHKLDEWFIEKYDPFISEKLKIERRNEALNSQNKFIENFKNGLYDDINLEVEDRVLSNNAVSGVYTNPEGEEKVIEELQQNKPSFHNEIYLDDEIDISNGPYYGFDPNSKTLFIKSIPRNISRWDILENLRKLPGFLSLSLSEPLKTHEYSRFGWILFDNEENCNKAGFNLAKFMLKNFHFIIVKSKSTKRPIKVTTKLDEERVTRDITLMIELISVLDKEKKLHQSEFLPEIQSRSIVKQLDLLQLYLRKIHSVCYYCAAEYHDERMLSAKCGPTHLRCKIEQTKYINISDWNAHVQEVFKNRIKETEKVIEVVHPSDELERKTFEKIKEKAEKKTHDNKWPCTVRNCIKGFEFLFKHIKTKHEAYFSDEKKEATELMVKENFNKDANKNQWIISPPFQTHSIHNSYMKKGGKPSGHNNFRGRNFQNNNQNKSMIPKAKQDFQANPKPYKDFDEPTKIEEGIQNYRNLINYNDI